MTHPEGDLDAITTAVQWLSDGTDRTTRCGSTSGRYIPTQTPDEQVFYDALVGLKLLRHDVRRRYQSLDKEEQADADDSSSDGSEGTKSTL